MKVKSSKKKLFDLASKYMELKQAYKDAEEDFKRVKELFEKELNDSGLIDGEKPSSLIGGKYLVRKLERKGSVNYAKIPELIGVNLEPYRKSNVSWVELREV